MCIRRLTTVVSHAMGDAEKRDIESLDEMRCVVQPRSRKRCWMIESILTCLFDASLCVACFVCYLMLGVCVSFVACRYSTEEPSRGMFSGVPLLGLNLVQRIEPVCDTMCVITPSLLSFVFLGLGFGYLVAGGWPGTRCATKYKRDNVLRFAQMVYGLLLVAVITMIACSLVAGVGCALIHRSCIDEATNTFPAGRRSALIAYGSLAFTIVAYALMYWFFAMRRCLRKKKTKSKKTRQD
jgi:hypothetical protein